MIVGRKKARLNILPPAAVARKPGINTKATIKNGTRNTKPSTKRAPKRMPTPAYCSAVATPGPPAITRLKYAGLHSPQIQFPAICSKFDWSKVRPHCEHEKTVWVGACWLIGCVPREESHAKPTASGSPRQA